MINQAFAQTVATTGGSSLSGTIAQLAIIFIIFYLFLIRPQQKAMKAHQEMLKAAKKGDKVITGGGIVGKIISANEDELEVEIAKDVNITIKRSTIKEVVLPQAKNDNKEPETKKIKKAKK